MGVLERDPIDRVKIDAIIIGEDSAQPRAGGGRKGADADAFAVQAGRRQPSKFRSGERVSMLKPPITTIGSSEAIRSCKRSEAPTDSFL
jgi:hypothetical protein